MEDQKENTEEIKSEDTEDNSGEGDKPKATGLIDSANAASERLEKANKEKAELLTREEDLEASKKLGGTSEAGYVPKKKTEDEKWAEDAKERYAGTGLDPTEDNTETKYI